MCARFFLRPDLVDLLDLLGVTAPPELDLARPNVAPTEPVPGVTGPVGDRRLDLYRWGLVPSWWTDARLPVWVNARAETAFDKPAFRHAARHRRLVVPVAGFYEWTTEGRRKVPHAIRPAIGGGFALAGVWERHGAGPDALRSAAILTTDASPAMARVHDRMPVILPPERWDAWLDPATDLDALRALLAPWPGELDVVEIGAAVGDVRDKSGSWFEGSAGAVSPPAGRPRPG